MLERFKVPTQDQVRVSHESLHRTVAAIFEKMGETPEDASVAADILVTADLRGVESHGVSNMMPYYIKYYENGTIKARPEWRIVRELPGTATIDADRGLVIILGPRAMQMAIDKAKKVGVGVVTIKNAGHSGALGSHAILAAEQDMVGVVMSAGGLRVSPTFARESLLGTNPIAVAAPARNEVPLLFDAAMCSVAVNKIRLAQRVGATLAPGWIADKDGGPLMEESPAPEEDTYSLLPLGGNREQGSHKGYGLALMVETLTTLISGAMPTLLGESQHISKHHFAAYNIEAFTDLEVFKDNMDQFLSALKNAETAPGQDRVIYPGIPEHEDERDRRVNGIPLHEEVVRWFEDTASEFAIPGLQVK